MRKCSVCKQEFEDGYFCKPDKFETGVIEYYKLCTNCRYIGNQSNKKRKSDKAKEFYKNNKDEIAKRNKEYRCANKEKLIAYDKGPKRKAAHRAWIKKTKQNDPCRFIFYSAKRRAKVDHLLFDLTKEDIVSIYPKNNKCPALDIELVVNTGHPKDNSPTIDRIVPSKGYVKGNIMIISYRANRIKNDSTLEELDKITSFLRRII